jgi:mannose-6-phosphate isomerase-like protein (cupin superfamily)
MRILSSDPSLAKGWYLGPWNSDLPLSIGYANRGVDDPHYHRTTTEIYLVGQGSVQASVNGNLIDLKAGDMLVIEPGERHTFLQSSPDYFHFVLHTPGLQGEEARLDKVLISDE